MNNNTNSLKIRRQVALVESMRHTMDIGEMRPEAGHDLAVLRLFWVWGSTGQKGTIPADHTDDELMAAYDTAFNPEAESHWNEILKECAAAMGPIERKRHESQAKSRGDTW